MAKAKIIGQGEMVWMSVLSMLIPAVLIIGALVYVAFYANGYDIFQKLVIIAIALIVIGVAEGVIWMVWAAGKGMMSWPQQK